jgi:acyl carrier protein
VHSAPNFAMLESMSDDILQRVIKVVAEAQKLPIEKITAESTFEELAIDSLDGIQLLFHLETEFDINIPDEAAREVRGIKELAEGVEKLVALKTA